MEYLRWFLDNYAGLITALNGALLAIIAFFMLIPGNQPEAFLQKVVDFISKFSKK